MATDLDDYAIHQVVENMEQVEGRNPRWVDELWFHVGTADGQLSVAGHMGVYPATATMDAAASVVHGGKQHDARFGRVVQGDRDRREVGGMTAEILEPFTSWRFRLAPADGQAASFDITLETPNQPMEVAGPVQHRRDGRQLIWDLWHYAQAGRASGTVTVNGQTLTLDPATAAGARERTWGVRPIFGQVPNLGTPPSSIGSRSLWLSAAFANQSLWLWRIEPANPAHANLTGSLADDTGRTRLDGAIAGAHGGTEPDRIVAAQPALELEADGKRLKGGTVGVTNWNGNTRELSIRPLTTLYAKGLGYGAGDFRHVEFKGDLAQCATVDLGGAAPPAELLSNESGHINPFGIEHFCEITSGGETGYGVVRLSI